MSGSEKINNTLLNANHSLFLNFTIDQTISGIASCYTFNRKLEKEMAFRSAEALTTYLREH
jgi:hypothetical protein